MPTSRPKPLAGIRILDLTRLLPGPMATLHLADMGAEVIKIEDQGVGDYARSMGPVVEGMTPFFRAVNRNKKFVTLDLKNDADRDRFLELVRDADAVIEGFRPGVMDKLGLGWARLRIENPRLVYAAITGYGCTGPLRDRAGHDINYTGYAGMLEQNAGADGTPVVGNLQVGDLLGGAQSAVIGVLAALLDAKTTGLGRFVDVSMTDAVFAHNVMPLAALNAGLPTPIPARDLLNGGVPCYGVYRTADGRHMAVGALELKFWQTLCEVIGRPDLKSGHWSMGQTPGGDEALAVQAELEALFATRTQADWTALFDPHDCCVTPILRADEAVRHPLFAARAMVVEQNGMQFAALPIQFSDFHFAIERVAQAPGADNAEVLGGIGVKRN